MALQAGSDSEQESNDGAGTSRKPQKRARGRVQPGNSKASDVQITSPMVPSGYVGLQLMKKKRTGGMLSYKKLQYNLPRKTKNELLSI